MKKILYIILLHITIILTMINCKENLHGTKLNKQQNTIKQDTILNLQNDSTYKIVKYGDCQYIEKQTNWSGMYFSRATHTITHKGDCDNVIHMYHDNLRK